MIHWRMFGWRVYPPAGKFMVVLSVVAGNEKEARLCVMEYAAGLYGKKCAEKIRVCAPDYVLEIGEVLESLAGGERIE